MGQIGKLNYGTKSNPNDVVDRLTQATAEDFNEIKEVVNNAVDGINWIKCDEQAVPAGTTPVAFIVPYPLGTPYVLFDIKCTDPGGYRLPYTLVAKDEDGFTITVAAACDVLYLAIPQR